jgi:hypothetical protein
VSAHLASDDEPDRERQTVVVNLALADDAALGSVVSALAPLGAHIVSLQKSEPTLEDVFVELVGRGFDSAADDQTAPAAPGGGAADGSPANGTAAHGTGIADEATTGADRYEPVGHVDPPDGGLRTDGPAAADGSGDGSDAAADREPARVER